MATEKRLIYVDEFKKNLCHYCNTYMSEEPCEPRECWVHDVIAQTDTVDAVEVVHGHWIPIPEYENKRCSVCRKVFSDFTLGYYCPNCGAKMDGDGNG